MESLIVHPKNQMELNALKSTLKDMGIVYEKFHTRNHKNSAAESHKKPAAKSSRPIPGEQKKSNGDRK